VIKDCTSAMGIDEKNIKAFHLKGIAFIELGKIASFDINEIIKGLSFLKDGFFYKKSFKI